MFTLLLATNWCAAQTSYGGKTSPHAPGCWGRTGIADKSAPAPLSVTRFVYLGVDPDSVTGAWRTELLVLAKAGKRRVFKAHDPDCVSPKRKDCKRWFTVDEPAHTVKLQVVLDTAGRTDFYTEVFEVKPSANAEAGLRWYRVPCNQDYVQFQEELDMALAAKGYATDNGGQESYLLRYQAIIDFTLDHDLPFGYVTEEMLSLLDMKSMEYYDSLKP